MAREPKCRRVESIPKVTMFKPAGVPLSCLEEVIVKLEELEAIRLKDLAGLEQEECAEQMGVSRPTFQRILIEGRGKIAAALIEGKAIRIEGGNYCLGQEQCRKAEQFQKKRDDCLYREDYARENTERKNGIAGTKIVICASGELPSASVDGRFGRCAYFMLWDDEQGSFEAISNSGPELNQGAGTGAAQELLRRGVGILICNRIGPKAFNVFRRSGVKVYGAVEGLDMKTALKQYKAGELPPIEAANNI
ncbi:MAG: hypothetical protein CVU90_02815 [Firmicutes bacterium HGW-Firmicutes-15]|nr:MAG: hypothetical protein CVU90_02815 [Firmicutes bacterium HGW-Firmicutes-15]